ncbi:magnesium transporter [Mycoplasmopsis pullorum]|uniref:magnesium transporter n=1 Tax=Mycoplasmopsis pullorum TaxID=48003 RepID=UPI00111A7C0E|nr:magnesium transporter [Mycoplasmopsis pullorum]TNK83998.1 magnesium transporter [Mycoplasmopsis pullorum]TNK92255.1 magnesium transporter [Mycoplasmopsis pullorum]
MDYTIEQIHEELVEIIKSKSILKAREFLDDHPYADVALAVENLPLNQQLYFFRILTTNEAAELFSYLEDESKTKLVNSFTEDWGKEIIQELQSDELADLLEELPVNLQKKILAETPPEKRNLINEILKFNDNQVGSIMSVDIFPIQNTWTCAKALRRIKEMYFDDEKEFTHYFYVTDEKGILLGSVTFEEIVFTDRSSTIDEIYSSVRSVHTYDNKEEAANIFADHDSSSLPVVNIENRLIGMITSDDVIDVIRDSATEDIYKIAGISAADSEEAYLKRSVLSFVKSRVFWLIILLISATLSELIIQTFLNFTENYFKLSLRVSLSAAIISSILPVISGSAGNAGSQASSTIIRAIALGEIPKGQYMKAIRKELCVALILGAILFIVNFLRLVVYFSISGDLIRQTKNILLFTLASSVSLYFVIIIAKLLGTAIPLVASRLKRDPAVMSAPILTTLSDAISVLFAFSTLILIFYLAYKVFVNQPASAMEVNALISLVN